DGYLQLERQLTRNLDPEDLRTALRAAFRDELVFSVNAFLIRTGTRTMLIDTGSGDFLGPTVGHVIRNLEAAGVRPDEIDTVLLTHMHPDHSAGLTDRATGELLYPSAELVVHENEPKHWDD